MNEIEETAARMIKRYESANKAAMMATYHAMDHEPRSQFHVYWIAVRDAIRRQGKGEK